RSLQESHAMFRRQHSTYSKCRIKATILYGKKTIRLRTGLLFAPDESGSEDLTPYRTEWNFGDIGGNDRWIELPFGVGDPSLFYREFQIVRSRRVRVGGSLRWKKEAFPFSAAETTAISEIGR